MDISIRTIQLIIAFIIFISIISLMIRKKSNANVSLIWLLVASGVILLGLFPQIIDFICVHLGIHYPPALIIVIAIASMLWIIFYISSELSVAQTRIRELAMQVSLLNNEVDCLKKEKSVDGSCVGR